MDAYRRFALYYLPPPGPLADFGAAWLGWDVEAGRPAPHPGLSGLPRPVSDLTATPRKYGFHGTLKPPFRLPEGTAPGALDQAVAELAAGLAPVSAGGLVLRRIGGFLALTPSGEAAALSALAATVVADLDRFRAPASDTELARRREAGLSPRQEALLGRWGYPYVMDEFRFHLTLTGALPPEVAAETQDRLHPVVAPLLPDPFVLDQIALVGERMDGCFERVQRYTLTG